MMKIALMRSQEGPEDSYCEYLLPLGTVRCIATLSFSFINLQTLVDYLTSPQLWGGIIFTSKRAVEASALSVGKEPLLAEWGAKPCFVVGEATSSVAAGLGFVCIGADCGSADKLAELIGRRYSGALPLLFVCGSMRRDALPNYMDANNIPYQSLVVYETVACSELRSDIMKFQQELESPSHIVYFSPSGYKFSHHIWKEVLGGDCDVVLVAIGNTTGAVMQGRGIVAKKPNPHSLYEAIEESRVT